ncbi:hypothetical protein PBI_HUFFY_79 [Gordonia phage Huffy]|nr:hypothetical protein PBI_HUFFY_79 [Gordonia phage Huffy]AQY55763.1 hypothetical protein PBI_DINODARYN_79 [Gordonia phage DinoDaryn]
MTGEDLGMPEYASSGYWDPECSAHGDGEQWQRGKADG